jgi:large subunit ribosomal protein L17
MRHRKDHRKLSRTASHRRALLRNLVTALFQYERIETTVAKAKEARRLAERLITFAKRGDVAARRHVARFVTRPEVVSKLFGTIAPWYGERMGGYTRIVRIGRRLGDAGETAYLELVKTAQQKESDRAARIAAAEARETALKADKAGKDKDKDKKTRADEEAPVAEEKPRRGRKKADGGGTSPAPPTKRTRKKTVTTG